MDKYNIFRCPNCDNMTMTSDWVDIGHCQTLAMRGTGISACNSQLVKMHVKIGDNGRIVIIDPNEIDG